MALQASKEIQHASRAGAKVKLGKLALQEERAAYLFLLPWLLGLALLLGIPVLASVVLSLTDWNLMNPPVFVGLKNYQRMFVDKDFYHSLGVTLKYLVLSVPIYLVSSLGLALLLNQKLKGMYFFRTVMFMPSVIAGTAVAVMWSMLLNPDLGVVNQFLRSIGIANPPRWLASNDWAVPAVILMGLWGIGGGTIIYLAGLQNIPPHLYEAAEIDGANSVQKFFAITLPLLTPTIFFTLITGLVGAFQVFDVAYVLNGRGARRGALLFYLLNLYDEGFRNSRFGYASALAWILVILAAVSILITFRASERFVYYESGSERK
ncbi:MAG: sugar ABC transporter permease [Chloroflexi bacterium]|nr:MAG: sugar ABC transporter permease [Chloroflexota bacterium]